MKIKLLTLVLVFNTLLIFSQGEIQNNNSSKKIKITNPTETVLLKLQEAGIDLRCGAIFKENSLQVEVSQFELDNLNKLGVPYIVEIDNLTKFYAERAAKDLPIAKAQLEAEKAKSKLKNKKNASTEIASKSISSVTLDNPLQYYGQNEVDWAVPSNFNFGSMGGCLTISEMEDELDDMRTLYPSLITVKATASTSGKTTYGFAGSGGWSGQTVYFVKISDNPDGVDDATEPDILYTSMIHSRELIALMGNIYYMWYLLENYATDPAVKNLVDNNELYFIPVVNPDGLRWNERTDPGGGGMQRKNLRANSIPNPEQNSGFSTGDGVDLNRNFDYLWGNAGDPSGSSGTYTNSGYRGPSAASEPETQILVEFVNAHNFETCVMHHSYANGIPHPYGGIPTKVSGREDEMHKMHEDMTRYNRYVSGATIFTAANGITDDWMLGGTADGNGSVGSGHAILATTPENGHGTEGGFWPSAVNITPIAKRMVRINFMNAYYGGRYAKFHDLTQSDITALSSNLTFGIERIGQTASDFTLTVTPISANITSIASPATEGGMSILEQRNVTAALVLDAGISVNDKIEYKVQLANGSGVVFYDVNFEKYYTPTVLFSDDPDTDIGIANWVESSNWVNTTTSAWSGTRSLKAGSAIPYANNINNTLTTTNSYDFSGANEILVQFYTKWDLERNFDFVEILGSTDGSSWQALNGKYNKPASTSNTNDAHGGKSGTSHSFQTNNSSGQVYDGDQFDNWVLEEIAINASENSFLVGAATAKFRFRFRTDANNRPENYSTTQEGFYLDDFKIIKVTIPCVTSVPINLTASSITATTATTGWDLIPSATYDLRYRVVGSPTWTDVSDLAITSYTIAGLTASTDYEVQVRSKCDASTSAYTTSETFTTLAVNYCDSNGNNTTDEYIGNVTLGTINNNSGVGTTSTGYSDYTSSPTATQTTELDISAASPSISVTKTWTGSNWDEAVSVWIDFNKNGVFTDAGENVFNSPSNQVTPVSGTITIPPTALLGNTRMRVSMKYNGVPTSCESFSHGEVEDYTVNIIDSTLGIEDEILSEFVLYPNPVSNGEIKLRMPKEITDFNVTISNVLGQKVYQKEVISNYDNLHKVNTTNLESGIYFVTVSTNLGKATKKMVIQ